MKALFACLEFQKSRDQIAERLGHYASLKNAEDSSNNDNLSRQAELTNLLTKVGEVAFVLIDREVVAGPFATAAEAVKARDKLESESERSRAL